jgi:hypothetical protein
MSSEQPDRNKLANPLWPLSPFSTDPLGNESIEPIGNVLIRVLDRLRQHNILTLKDGCLNFTDTAREEKFFLELRLSFSQTELTVGVKEFVDFIMSLTPAARRLKTMTMDSNIAYLIDWVTRWHDIKNDFARNEIFELIAALSADDSIEEPMAAIVVIALFVRERLVNLIP